MNLNSFETLEIYIEDRYNDRGYAGYLLFASHNVEFYRNFAGFLSGCSNSWGWGVKFNKLFLDETLVEIKNGTKEDKPLKIINKTKSQFEIQIFCLYDNFNDSTLYGKIKK